MSEAATWAVIGYRGPENPNIGGEVVRQLGQPEVAHRLGLKTLPEFVLTTSGMYRPDTHEPIGNGNIKDISDDEFPDVVFVGLPSSKYGQPAYEYMSPILGRGKIVITAEKGAMANFYDEMRVKSDNFARLGVTATVGGGTSMLETSAAYFEDLDNVTQVHGALNGTLTFIFDSMTPSADNPNGMTFEEAVQAAVDNKYAEPLGNRGTGIDVIKGEAEGDIPKKLSILFNKLRLGPTLLKWREIDFELTQEEIQEAIDDAPNRRFIISLINKRHEEHVRATSTDTRLGGFSVEHDGWILEGGFMKRGGNPIQDDLFELHGPGNGLIVGQGPNEEDAINMPAKGPGAGVRPTVNTMLDDYSRIIRREAEFAERVRSLGNAA